MGYYKVVVELGAEVDPLNAEAIEKKLDLLLNPFAEWRYAKPHSDKPYKVNPDEHFDARGMAYHQPYQGESKSYQKIITTRFAVLGSGPVENSPGSPLTCEVIYKKDFETQDQSVWSFVNAAGQWFEFKECKDEVNALFEDEWSKLAARAVLVLVAYHA
jgi:hypothetical protein